MMDRKLELFFSVSEPKNCATVLRIGVARASRRWNELIEARWDMNKTIVG